MKLLLHIAVPLILIIGLAYPLKAQRMQDWVLLGDRALQDNDPGGALRYYKKAMEIDSSKGELNYKYAEALRLNHKYSKAAYHYEKVFRRERGKLFPQGPYWLATMQKQAGNYDESKQTWRKVRNQWKQDTTSYFYRKSIQELRAIDIATTIKSDTQVTRISLLPSPVNSDGSDFAGQYRNNGSLIFSSLRGETNEKGEVLDSENYRVSIYLSDSVKNTASVVSSSLNGKHIANGSFTYDEQVLFLSVCSDDNICSIYKGDYHSGIVSNLIAVEELKGDSLHSFTQPHYCELNGEPHLFFVSNQEAGSSFMDIFLSKLSKNFQIIDTEHLTKNINSPGNEISPFFSPRENRLYFSSDWHYGLGGFDIFSSDFTGLDWLRPENMGMDFNSPANDLYFSLNNQLQKGLLTSNREGESCCNNLYEFAFTSILSEDDLPEITSLEDLNKYLPVTLYFDNDQPNPRSRATSTIQNYLDTYYTYTSRLPVYEQEYGRGLNELQQEKAEEEMDLFFVEEVDQGVADLQLFSDLLLRELEKGSRIEVTIKGYASPLAESDYNVNLTSRRISSLRNYFLEYQDGAIGQYMEGIAAPGELAIIEVPFGEYTAQSFVSDNPNDKSNAIYSIAAARERKIEIISVQQALADSSVAVLSFDSEIKNLGLISGENQQTVQFSLSNSGNIPLQIDSIVSKPRIKVEYPEETVAPQQTGLLVCYIEEFSAGKNRITLGVYYNGGIEPRELNITYERD